MKSVREFLSLTFLSFYVGNKNQINFLKFLLSHFNHKENASYFNEKQITTLFLFYNCCSWTQTPNTNRYSGPGGVYVRLSFNVHDIFISWVTTRQPWREGTSGLVKLVTHRRQTREQHPRGSFQDVSNVGGGSSWGFARQTARTFSWVQRECVTNTRRLSEPQLWPTGEKNDDLTVWHQIRLWS